MCPIHSWMTTSLESEEATLRHHDAQVRRVLECLKEHQMVADLEKSHFFCRRVEFCGHVLEKGQRKPAPGKLCALEKWTLPRTITELRGFVGLANVYHLYCPHFAEIIAPLTEKLKGLPKEDSRKGSQAPVHYSEEEKLAFERVKEELLKGLSLQVVDPDRPFVLRVDACKYGVGASLEQLPGPGMPNEEDAKAGRTRPVAFFSRKLTPTQRRQWDVREKEAYAIILSLEKFASWIGLQPLVVLSDHETLKAWHKDAVDIPGGPSGRRARWHRLLSKFSISVAFVPGKTNVVADSFSRWAYPASKGLEECSIHGSAEDARLMAEMIRQERKDEKTCIFALRMVPRDTADQESGSSAPNAARVQVVTRSGAKTQGPEVTDPPANTTPAAPHSNAAPSSVEMPAPADPPMSVSTHAAPMPLPTAVPAKAIFGSDWAE